MLVCCNAIGKGCGTVGKAFGFACDGIDQCICPPDRPTPLFVFFSFSINLAGIILSVFGIFSFKDECKKDLKIWFITNLVVSFINLLFAFYLYKRLADKLKEGGTAGMLNILMYDIGVYIYLFVVAFCISWAIIGSIWSGDEGCSIKPIVTTCVALLWIYVAMGSCIVACTICTQCGARPSWKNEPYPHVLIVQSNLGYNIVSTSQQSNNISNNQPLYGNEYNQQQITNVHAQPTPQEMPSRYVSSNVNSQQIYPQAVSPGYSPAYVNSQQQMVQVNAETSTRPNPIIRRLNAAIGGLFGNRNH